MKIIPQGWQGGGKVGKKGKKNMKRWMEKRRD